VHRLPVFKSQLYYFVAVWYCIKYLISQGLGSFICNVGLMIVSTAKGFFFFPALGFELRASHLLGALPLEPLHQPCKRFVSELSEDSMKSA
jgi:hypothetical protein